MIYFQRVMSFFTETKTPFTLKKLQLDFSALGSGANEFECKSSRPQIEFGVEYREKNSSETRIPPGCDLAPPPRGTS